MAKTEDTGSPLLKGSQRRQQYLCRDTTPCSKATLVLHCAASRQSRTPRTPPKKSFLCRIHFRFGYAHPGPRRREGANARHQRTSNSGAEPHHHTYPRARGARTAMPRLVPGPLPGRQARLAGAACVEPRPWVSSRFHYKRCNSRRIGSAASFRGEPRLVLGLLPLYSGC